MIGQSYVRRNEEGGKVNDLAEKIRTLVQDQQRSKEITKDWSEKTFKEICEAYKEFDSRDGIRIVQSTKNTITIYKGDLIKGYITKSVNSIGVTSKIENPAKLYFMADNELLRTVVIDLMANLIKE